MANLSYRQAGLILKAGGSASQPQILDLQRDLRRLGYLKSGMDGVFGSGTTRAVMALRHDMMNNDGNGSDGNAPVSVTDFNQGRVIAVTGEVDQPLVECISDLLDDTAFPALPSNPDPVAENQKIVQQIRALPPAQVPTLFLMAILQQESGLKHFHEPQGEDQDTFIVVGLDTNQGSDHIITSRGYGAGQYTLFHHPPTSDEVNDFMLDVGKNVQRASGELRSKFDNFVNGPDSNTQAGDRQAEFGNGPLRLCKFTPADPRFMTDCRQCVLDAGVQDLRKSVTPLFPGSAQTYQPTTLRNDFQVYAGVPVRREIGCDWPYAVRRYNGSGMDSYHYQAKVLLHLKAL
jgi:hypothetical protein